MSLAQLEVCLEACSLNYFLEVKLEEDGFSRGALPLVHIQLKLGFFLLASCYMLFYVSRELVVLVVDLFL